MSKCNCYECDFCKDNRRAGNTRGAYYCKHPNQSYIIDFFKQHKINKMPGFIGFGQKYENYPSNKTTPKWCPKLQS